MLNFVEHVDKVFALFVPYENVNWPCFHGEIEMKLSSNQNAAILSMNLVKTVLVLVELL